MSTLAWDLLLIMVLILIGGSFAAAEVAMISLREGQVRRLAETRGRRGRRLSLLVADPDRFLASVQIGITVTTILAAAIGAATVAPRVAESWISFGMTENAADPLALVVVTLIVAFLALVLGELAPKRLGLQHSEGIALAASGSLAVLARLLRPIVWLLERASSVVARVLGGNSKGADSVMSPDELRSLVLAHGSLTSVERRMIVDVFDAETTRVREVMVPRPEVEFLPASMSVSRAARTALGQSHSRFPVIGHDSDEVVGVVHLRDLLAPGHPLGRAASVGDVCHPVTVLPGTKGVLDALQEMRAAGDHLAVVLDEYGGTDGIVTLEDLVEEIVGEMVEQGQRQVGAEPDVPGGRLADVDGRLNLDDFAEVTGIVLPAGPYDTAAGFLMAGLGRLPQAGDAVACGDRVLTVAAMEGRRVARIEIRAAAE